MSITFAVSFKWAAITLGLAVLYIVGSIVLLSFMPEKKTVSNFDECIDAGGARMESYPEQCSYEGRTYPNPNQRSPKTPENEKDQYIGLTEDEGLLRADGRKTPARVVERDGEPLPITMDLVYGRHNFYVRDGLIYRVEIEGTEQDTPSAIE